MNNTSPVRPGAQYLVYQDLHEVVSVDPTQISLRSIQNKRFVYIPHDTFRVLQISGEVMLHQQAPIDKSLASILTNLDTEQSGKLQRAIYYVRALAKEFNGILPRAQTITAIKSLAASRGDPKPPGYTTAYNWFKVYKKANYNPLALLKTPSHRPRGKQLGEEVHAIIREHIHTFYLKRPHPSVKILHGFIKTHIENKNSARMLTNAPLLNAPSKSSVHRDINKINRYLLDLKHHGKKFADKAHKYGLKHAASPTLLAQVQGDSHLVNLELIDDEGNNLGKPWLILLIEIKTRCIIGWELSFTPPCTEKALRAFRMALEVSENNQPGGRWEETGLDNGVETANPAIQNLAYIVGFELTYGPPGCPDVKAQIERFFGTLNTGLIHIIPGTTYSNPQERGDYNSKKNACLTIEQLNEKFARWIKDVYHELPHSGLGQSPRMAWEAAMEHQLPPERYSKNDMDELCRSLTFRKVRNGVVHLFGLTWTGPSLSEIAHRLKPNQKALVHYDSSDLSKVWLAHPDHPTEQVEAFATDPNYQNHLTLFEHQLVQAELKKKRQCYSETHARQALLEIHTEIQELYEQHKNRSGYKKSKTNKKSEKKARQNKRLKNTYNNSVSLASQSAAESERVTTPLEDLPLPTAYPVVTFKDSHNE